MSRRRFLALVVVLALAPGLAGCSQGEETPKVTPTSSGSPSPTPSSQTGEPSSPASSPASPVAGLPSDFPTQQDVPLVPGVVTTEDSGTQSNGLRGWQLELEAVGTQQGCFDRAAAALVSAGFAKQAEMTAGDTKQAQYTTAKWAVIISSRSDGENCQLGYEVGQLSK